VTGGEEIGLAKPTADGWTTSFSNMKAIGGNLNKIEQGIR
jgi:hypothetical protein